jgi:hypothetical protein
MSKKRGGADEPEGKDELRRQMEETRARMSETVAEIKSVVAQQFEEVRGTVESVKEGVGEVLDWREQFERNPLVWGAGAVSVGILIGFGIARAFDERDAHGRRKKSPSKAAHMVAELGGLAEVVLPTISGKVKELFGLDLDAYLRAAHDERRRPARKSAPKKVGAGKTRADAKRAASKSRAPKKKSK